MRFTRILAVLVALVGLAPTASMAAQAQVAVAANFADAARELAAEYGKESGHRIDISTASTGKLYAQIRNGAPFDALLAADATTPRKLASDGLASDSTLHDYAVGRLVLWSRDPLLVIDGQDLLLHGRIDRLAIANPELAPYGTAARDVLRRVGRWEELQARLATGENVGQAAQFVASGAAPLALLPRSLVMEAQKSMPGSAWEVPAAWHSPIVQSAVLLKRGQDNVAARGFLQYLRSPSAQARIRALGYD